MSTVAPVFQFLEGLNGSTVERLFVQPATCLAVFRALPGLGQMFVYRMLTLGAIPKASVLAWCQPQSLSVAEAALSRLVSLRVCVMSNDTVSLSPTFRRHFEAALLGSGPAESFGVAYGGEERESSSGASIEAILEKTAKDRWESILYFMVGIPAVVNPSDGVRSLLTRSNLMTDTYDPASPHSRYPTVLIVGGSGSHGKLEITTKGFQFLLQSVNEQVWAFLLQYVDMAKDLNMDRTDVVNFLLQLGSMTFGRQYDVRGLNDVQLTLLEDLKDFGLIYRRKPDSRSYYPTRLATTLISGVTNAPSQEEEGFIVVETNYRVYAYTDSPLQIAILQHFCHLIYRFANMAVLTIRRESIRAALLKGITAEQILGYLRTNSHPQARTRAHWIPPTVADQIRLWQSERDRINPQAGVLYDSFSSLSEYEATRAYANDLDVLLYSALHNGNGMLVVSAAGHEKVVDFVKRRARSAA